MNRKPTRDYLFIDESGDPGKDISAGSSTHYVLGCIHITNLGLEKLNKHLYAMSYFSGRHRELKSSRLGRVQKDHIEDIAKWLIDSSDSSITVVLLDKERYLGPYLGAGQYVYNAIRFRNFITRQLLELHFNCLNLSTNECELVFDRAMSEDAENNLKQYLRGNFRLPAFTSIVHCDSRYVPALQFVDATVHIVKEYIFNKRISVDGRMLHSINVFNISNPKNPIKIF